MPSCLTATCELRNRSACSVSCGKGKTTQTAVCVSTSGQTLPMAMCPTCQLSVQTECVLPACLAYTPSPAPPLPPQTAQESPFVSLSTFLRSEGAGSKQAWVSRAGGYTMSVIPNDSATPLGGTRPKSYVLQAESVALRPTFSGDIDGDGDVDRDDADLLDKELRTVVSQPQILIAPHQVYRLTARLTVLHQRPGNELKLFVEAQDAKRRTLLFEQSPAFHLIGVSDVQDVVFVTPIAMRSTITVGLRWTQSPWGTVGRRRQARNASHVVQIAEIELQHEDLSVPRRAGEALSVVAALAIAISILASAVGSASVALATAPGNWMGIVQQIQLQGMLSRIDGCPAPFAAFAKGFDWTLFSWGLPWGSGNVLLNQSTVTRVLWWMSLVLSVLAMSHVLLWWAFTKHLDRYMQAWIDSKQADSSSQGGAAPGVLGQTPPQSTRSQGSQQWGRLAMQVAHRTLKFCILFPRLEFAVAVVYFQPLTLAVWEGLRMSTCSFSCPPQDGTDKALFAISFLALCLFLLPYPVAFFYLVYCKVDHNGDGRAVDWVSAESFDAADAKGAAILWQVSGKWRRHNSEQFLEKYGLWFEIFGKRWHACLYRGVEAVRMFLVGALVGSLEGTNGVAATALLFIIYALTASLIFGLRPFIEHAQNIVEGVAMIFTTGTFFIFIFSAKDAEHVLNSTTFGILLGIVSTIPIVIKIIAQLWPLVAACWGLAGHNLPGATGARSEEIIGSLEADLNRDQSKSCELQLTISSGSQLASTAPDEIGASAASKARPHAASSEPDSSRNHASEARILFHLSAPLPHLHRAGLTPPTSAPGLGSPLPHLLCHICTETGLAPATSGRGWALRCLVCTGTGLSPLATSAQARGRLCAVRRVTRSMRPRLPKQPSRPEPCL